MKGFQEKCEKPPLLGILGQNGENYQKSAWNIFLALTSQAVKCNFQKKVKKSNTNFGKKVKKK